MPALLGVERLWIYPSACITGKFVSQAWLQTGAAARPGKTWACTKESWAIFLWCCKRSIGPIDGERGIQSSATS